MGRVRTPLARGRKFSALRDEFAIRRKELRARTIGAPPQNPKFSVVSAVYNVEKYLDDYFTSIVLQPEFLGQIQVIVVNDGSTDRSLEILNAWQRRFPHNIMVVSQENGGQASARNLGMTYATGEWVTFIDPDDFIARNYFAQLLQFMDAYDRPTQSLHVVSCNLAFYHEKTQEYKDNHPLRYRFEEDASLPIGDLGDFLPGAVSQAFFRRDRLQQYSVSFDKRVWPTFEDGKFMASYLLACGDGIMGFAKSPRYYYRKREDGTSTIDLSQRQPERFDNVYRDGYTSILQEAQEKLGTIPRWLQRAVLYDMIWHVKQFTGADEKIGFLSPEQRSTFALRVKETMDLLQEETIASFELADTHEMHRAGLLSRYKSSVIPVPKVWIESFDHAKGTFVLTWYSGSIASHISCTIDGRFVAPLETKAQRHSFLEAPFVYQHRARFQGRAGWLVASLDGRAAGIVPSPGQRPVPRTSLSSLKAPKAPVHTTAAISRIRKLSQKPDAKLLYKNAWLLIDRDLQADDSAEILYRYIRELHPDINAFFSIRRDAHDWPRLAADGFNLIPFDSDEYGIALLNADYLISTQADGYVTRYFPAGSVDDLKKSKYVFLQHGVIRDDISRWINKQPIDLMLTSSYAEHASIVDDDALYKLLPSEVSLTGLPRHDALLLNPPCPKRQILVVPTWRDYLAGKVVGKGSHRSIRYDFTESNYARGWRDFMNSPRFRHLAEEHGYKIVFFPHLNIEPYAKDLVRSDDIKILKPSDNHPIREVIRNSAIMITDYSSVAFEMALLGRGVIYYQFDADEYYAGGHASRRGYFDFERDGFGPVGVDTESVLDGLQSVLKNNGSPEETFKLRAMTTFKWRDGQACARVIEAIKRMGHWPNPAIPQLTVNHAVGGCWQSGASRESREVLSNLSSRECGF